MASFPAALYSGTSVAGTTLVSVGDHANMHNNVQDEITAIETSVGTNSGTNVLKSFVAGNFPARINSSNVLQQALTGTVTLTSGTINSSLVTGGTVNAVAGTLNATVIGTPAITGGTYTNMYPSGPFVDFAYVSANRSTDSGTLPVGTATLLVYDAEDFDLGADYNNTSGTFIAPANGLYRVVAQAYIYNEITDARQYHIQIAKNGTVVKDGRQPSSGVGPSIPQVNWLGSLATNDAISFFAISNSATGSSKVFGNASESFMSIEQVTRT